MVAMGRALMSRPRLLLMDEPSMGLAPILVERSFEMIQEVHETGVAILVVEQNANMALSVADRGYVLQTGRVVLTDRRTRCSRTRSCGRPTLVGDALRAALPDPGAARVRQLLLAGRALGRGARLLRALSRRLGRAGLAVGATGSSATRRHARRSRG